MLILVIKKVMKVLRFGGDRCSSQPSAFLGLVFSFFFFFDLVCYQGPRVEPTRVQENVHM